MFQPFKRTYVRKNDIARHKETGTIGAVITTFNNNGVSFTVFGPFANDNSSDDLTGSMILVRSDKLEPGWYQEWN